MFIRNFHLSNPDYSAIRNSSNSQDLPIFHHRKDIPPLHHTQTFPHLLQIFIHSDNVFTTNNQSSVTAAETDYTDEYEDCKYCNQYLKNHN